MTRNIIVEELPFAPIENGPTEIVERKGVGHPDSIADGLAETVSRALCKMYLEKFNTILHHNTDEVQIVGGQSAPAFGGGVVLEPVYILLVGRATTEVNGKRLPYRSLAIRAAREYLEQVCPHLDVDMDVMLDCRIGQGSVDLRGLYETKKLLANDTSFGVSFAPLSETEKITYETERHINGPLKEELPEVGQDVKVMSWRNEDKLNLTVASAMVDRLIPDVDHYKSVVEDLSEKVKDQVSKMTSRSVRVFVNNADNYEEGVYYLTVTGLSMENGDDGSVGRGNRVNGLITPYRPMSMEAAAGKNPVTHVGKLYNVISHMIANDIARECGGDVLEVQVRIVSQIGAPIDMPQAASAQLILADGVKMSQVESNILGLMDSHLSDISSLTEKLVNGEISVF
ncbi:MAG: methionine adenosyltransferase [Methanobacteriota archaeon]|nr:MAG: methionine adenosyltransferase [Euryarchaeota archaeon]